MLIVMIVLIVLAIGTTKIAYKNDYNLSSAISIVGAILLGIISLTLVVIIMVGYSDGYTAGDKITMYEEENSKIEEQITTIVNNYQGYEKEIITNVADMEVLLIKLPELKTSELVKAQIEMYINNNNKIKELKEKQIDMRIYKWLLYFG